MPDVEIYTTMFCGYSHHAKSLLEKKGVAFREIDVTFDAGERNAMTERAGGSSTVPQVFIGGEHIGGCDELVALDRAGDLDAKLAGDLNAKLAGGRDAKLEDAT
jgi:glutaredoxin 3